MYSLPISAAYFVRDIFCKCVCMHSDLIWVNWTHERYSKGYAVVQMVKHNKIHELFNVWSNLFSVSIFLHWIYAFILYTFLQYRAQLNLNIVVVTTPPRMQAANINQLSLWPR